MPCSRALSLLLCLGLLFGRPARAELSITFIDVGQGDAALILSPTGKSVLIDGGMPEAGEAVLGALRRRGVTRIDLMLLTHPHMDHLGGLIRVARSLAVGTYLDSGFPHPSPGYSALLSAIREQGAMVRNAEMGRRIEIGDGAVLTLLGPPAPYLRGTRSDVNANSVLVALGYRNVSALFTGDAEPETERFLLAQKGIPLRAQLLKVAHHGGRYSSTSAFLQAVLPQIAVLSCGAKNDYGHPHPETLARLSGVGARIYRTDLQGDVLARSMDGQRWEVVAARAVVGERGPGAASPLAPSSRFAASRRSDAFHLAACKAVQSIHPDNLLRFPSREAALASGRRPALDCQP